ncbi:MAG: hypothetical protein IJ049_01290 [Oscillospiraceae bacterium]|nr:hypothetical protein [Oscillospiraceae bacterium]
MFHDSTFGSVLFEKADMMWEICGAIVIGHSCPEVTNRVPSSANDGEDRYADPTLKLTFCNYKIISVLRGGGWSIDNKGNRTEYPEQELEHKYFREILKEAVENVSEIMSFIRKKDQFVFDIIGREDYYKLTFQADQVIAEWESLGEEAWYLEHYRKNREMNQEKK